jgi:hypothetical protein
MTKPEPAFPVPDVHYPNGQIQFGSNGMTLRDYFAAKAMAAFLSSPDDANYYEKHPGLLADSAYNIADAMLAERTK